MMSLISVGTVPKRNDARKGADMKRKKRGFFGQLFRLIFRFLLICAVIIGGFAFWAVVTSPQLDLKKVAPQRYRTAMLDSDGKVMRYLAGEEANREYVPLDKIPQSVREAFIAIEDQRFYHHHGIDLWGIGRAVVHDVKTRSFSQGASTLTQQLIKNNLFAAGMEERTPLEKLKRKVQEQYLSVVLEGLKEKDWILENYLNTIDLGGVWGVEAAALKYFGRGVETLSVGEAAAIAAITKNPSAYNPLRHEEESRNRQELVLWEMYAQGYLNRAEYDAAMSEDVYGTVRRVAESGESAGPVYTWFEDAVLEEVREDLERVAHYSPEACWELIYSGGLTIETTQDTDIQRACEEAIARIRSDAQFTAVVMDHSAGAVLGIVGAKGEKSVSRALNRATSSVRQPGSVLKPIGAYAEALESGAATLASVFPDRPTRYRTGSGAVRNADGVYHGWMTVRDAIAQSVNTIALQCFQDVGLDAVWDRLQLFGFSHLGDEDRVEALALGGTYHGVTNLELTAAYAAIANGGTYVEPHFYTRVLDQDGKVILQKTPSRRRAVSEETAALLTAGMEEVLLSGTGRRAAFAGQPLAGKTGTTTDQRDLWFVGYSPYYACGVWSGYDDNSPQTVNEVLPVWREIMGSAHVRLPSVQFPRPDGMKYYEICAKCGALAVSGLCDDALQGDMARWELFVSGTQPEHFCDCHIRVNVCLDSGQLAGPYCPRAETRVLLREAMSGTEEEDQLAPKRFCTTHTEPWFSEFWNGTPSAPESGGLSTAPEHDNPPSAPPETSDGQSQSQNPNQWAEDLWDEWRRHMFGDE